MKYARVEAARNDEMGHRCATAPFSNSSTAVPYDGGQPDGPERAPRRRPPARTGDTVEDLLPR